MMTAKELKLRESQADEGCLMAPDETREMLAEIRNLREAMREAMEDKNANADSIAPLGRALGYSRNEWGEWVIPQSPADIPERPQDELEQELRHIMWMSHGHSGIYGDDGEMQCGACAAFGCWDYKNAPLNEVRTAYQIATLSRHSAPIPDRPLPRVEPHAQFMRCEVCRESIIDCRCKVSEPIQTAPAPQDDKEFVLATYPTAYCLPNEAKGRTPGLDFCIKHNKWMGLSSWKPTEAEAWADARKRIESSPAPVKESIWLLDESATWRLPIEPGQAATPELWNEIEISWQGGHVFAGPFIRERVRWTPDQAIQFAEYLRTAAAKASNAPTPEAGSQLEQARTLLRRTVPFVTCIDGCDCAGCKLTTEIKTFLSPARPEEEKHVTRGDNEVEG